MKIFDNKGMLIIPNPMRGGLSEKPKVLIINQLFCPNRHNLITQRVTFNGYPGILIKVRQDGATGLIALSPFYGEHSRFSLDIDLIDGKLLELMCPVCEVEMPVISQCECGGNLVAFFLTQDCNFNDCVGICTRVNCHNSRIRHGGELITRSILESL
ncbi:MAG TPA: hypothetical protein P5268_06420 [Candidatus Marinimicrobia bacterium]|nr:hypothetical protein [Candidatus Neomarinimicrobiota bacterium]HRS51802.1 hypothetical protein [Candidatus Neomarinimicrobiota bacterium]HRU92646.1 hypothetical protein [Candidatus Neomarinimicrobiota bacterium]